MTPHTCQTTFAGGVNPWGPYTPLLQGVMHPVRRAMIQLLADGKHRTPPEAAASLGAPLNSTGTLLRTMYLDGLVKSGMRTLEVPTARHTQVTEYWVET